MSNAIRTGILYLQDRLSGQKQPVRVHLTKHILSVQSRWAPARRTQTVKLERSSTDGLGFSIKGGAETRRGAPCIVSKIFANSPAHAAEGIDEGDSIIRVDNKDVSNETHDHVVDILQKAGKVVTLVVHQGPQAHDFGKDSCDGWVESLAVPLERASLTRYREPSDPTHDTAFELYSMDRTLSCILHCENKISFSTWFHTIRSHIETENTSCLVRVNRTLPRKDRVVRIGWVDEYLPASHHWNTYVPKFLVLRSRCLEIFTYAPQSSQEWLRPERSYDLSQLLVFQVHEDKLVDENPFCLQVQTGLGEDHYFSTTTKDEMTAWLSVVGKTTRSLIQSIGLKTIDCMWRGRTAKLQIDINQGFALIDTLDGSTIWQHTFSSLRASSDDGYKIVKLTFGPKQSSRQETHQIEVDNVVTLAYSIRAFLSAKIASYD
ncbi:gamma-2-syntrophin-like [Corticium candelabrum]|uniref:gamma-2-syntrophin-like n=1 Tax=Corticium candelabrum TaxID=121492 RepID=UPI002E272863|nr:gamma-2-syntrophin-like [Corticium candelabrum]